MGKYMSNKVIITLLSVLIAAIVAVTGVAVVVYNDRYSQESSSVFSDTSSEVESEESSFVSSEVSSEQSSEPSSALPTPAPTPEFQPGDKYYDIYLAVKGLDNSRHGYGFRVSSDTAKRPGLAISQQNAYGKYGMNSIEKDSGHIYLTFDEGWENGYTSRILDVLKQKNIKATFFVTMSYVKSRPDLVRRMINEGHVVGNHSVNHPDMTSVSIKRAINEIMDLHYYMIENFGYEMHLFRPPTGAYSVRTLEIARLLGYRTVEWSFAYADWDEKNQPDKTFAYNYVTGQTHGGAIYLLHAVSSTNADILGDVIDYWLKEGYSVGEYPNCKPDTPLPEVKPAPTPAPVTPPEEPSSSENSSNNQGGGQEEDDSLLDENETSSSD